jgi:hypothetical protein
MTERRAAFDRMLIEPAFGDTGTTADYAARAAAG